MQKDSCNYGYVCFAYTDVWYDWCISKVTSSQWSHSFITIPPILGREMTLEAVSSGVSVCQFDIEYRDNPKVKYEVYQFKIHNDKMDFAIIQCMNKLESSYGFLEYPWLIWRSINKIFGVDIKSQNNWCQEGTICSGLVRAYIENCGYKLFTNFGKDAPTPQDVYEIVQSRKDLFELVEKKS